MFQSDDAERQLRQQLADLHVMHHRQAEPILEQLARIEALKPPKPVWAAGQWFQFKPEVYSQITGKPAPVPETPGERMRRLEYERRDLLHMLRMVRSAAYGALPPSLTDQVDRTIKDMDP